MIIGDSIILYRFVKAYTVNVWVNKYISTTFSEHYVWQNRLNAETQVTLTCALLLYF